MLARKLEYVQGRAVGKVWKQAKRPTFGRQVDGVGQGVEGTFLSSHFAAGRLRTEFEESMWDKISRDRRFEGRRIVYGGSRRESKYLRDGDHVCSSLVGSHDTAHQAVTDCKGAKYCAESADLIVGTDCVYYFTPDDIGALLQNHESKFAIFGSDCPLVGGCGVKYDGEMAWRRLSLNAPGLVRSSRVAVSSDPQSMETWVHSDMQWLLESNGARTRYGTVSWSVFLTGGGRSAYLFQLTDLEPMLFPAIRGDLYDWVHGGIQPHRYFGEEDVCYTSEQVYEVLGSFRANTAVAGVVRVRDVEEIVAFLLRQQSAKWAEAARNKAGSMSQGQWDVEAMAALAVRLAEQCRQDSGYADSSSWAAFKRGWGSWWAMLKRHGCLATCGCGTLGTRDFRDRPRGARPPTGAEKQPQVVCRGEELLKEPYTDKGKTVVFRAYGAETMSRSGRLETPVLAQLSVDKCSACPHGLDPQSASKMSLVGLRVEGALVKEMCGCVLNGAAACFHRCMKPLDGLDADLLSEGVRAALSDVREAMVIGEMPKYSDHGDLVEALLDWRIHRQAQFDFRIMSLEEWADRGTFTSDRARTLRETLGIGLPGEPMRVAGFIKTEVNMPKKEEQVMLFDVVGKPRIIRPVPTTLRCVVGPSFFSASQVVKAVFAEGSFISTCGMCSDEMGALTHDAVTRMGSSAEYINLDYSNMDGTNLWMGARGFAAGMLAKLGFPLDELALDRRSCMKFKTFFGGAAKNGGYGFKFEELFSSLFSGHDATGLYNVVDNLGVQMAACVRVARERGEAIEYRRVEVELPAHWLPSLHVPWSGFAAHGDEHDVQMLEWARTIGVLPLGVAGGHTSRVVHVATFPWYQGMAQGDDAFAVVHKDYREAFVRNLTEITQNMGLKPEFTVVDSLARAEFVSARPWPTEGTIVWGPKIGRILARGGFKLTRHKKVWEDQMRGDVKSLETALSMVPLGSEYLSAIRRCVGKGRESIAKDARYKIRPRVSHTLDSTTESFFFRVYGLGPVSLAAMRAELNAVVSLPAVLTHSGFKTLAIVDS